jgi:hypothetical protein
MKAFIFIITILYTVLALAYIGISKDLCRRNYSQETYKEMQLDCDYWLYKIGN